ncbi:hypothetical protein C8Q76DRAFT_799299 [Earliella scabrosa]|nr:hypothetical protein C8Q76DRAFT_799299 [Earliella scabrosa]
MTRAQASNFRLPSYRSSFLERGHPYGRAVAVHNEDRLMTTIDYRYTTPPIVEVSSLPPRSEGPRCEELPDPDASVLDLPVVGLEPEDGELPVPERLSGSRLARTFSARAKALCNKYLTKQAARDFLVPKSVTRPSEPKK